MSRAFVKEDGGDRWEAPAAAKAYRVVWTGRSSAGSPQGEVLRESDDLVELLLWVRGRAQGSYALQSAEGTLLAQVQNAA